MTGIARAAAVGLVLAVLPACAGAASGADWVREPESSAALGDTRGAFEDDPRTTLLLSEAAPRSGPRRLDRTVTLGEVVDSGSASAVTGASPGQGPTVVVTVNNSVQPVYAGYGYLGASVVDNGFGQHAEHRSSRASSSSVVPGQSFPAPPSYGPSFPYSTSPASPWGAQRR